jgi:hypothetical protein
VVVCAEFPSAVIAIAVTGKFMAARGTSYNTGIRTIFTVTLPG